MKKENKEKENKEKENKKKKISYPWLVIFVICFGILIYSGYNIIIWHIDNKNTQEEIKNIENDIVVIEVPMNEEETELINPPKEDELQKPNDYWDFIKMPLIDVDFTKLIERNKDTVAFIKVNNTNINYPVVQTTNNEYYLDHSFNKNKNSAGWVFMDYRNSIDEMDDNTIIYAHGRKDDTMFGTLKNMVNSTWYTDKNNQIIYLSTTKENTMWQIFSIYIIPEETYYLTSNFGTDESHQKFIDTIVSRSNYNFETEVNINDKILTLSTCSNHTNRVVVHAKLIKKQSK